MLRNCARPRTCGCGQSRGFLRICTGRTHCRCPYLYSSGGCGSECAHTAMPMRALTLCANKKPFRLHTMLAHRLLVSQMQPKGLYVSLCQQLDQRIINTFWLTGQPMQAARPRYLRRNAPYIKPAKAVANTTKPSPFVPHIVWATKLTAHRTSGIALARQPRSHTRCSQSARPAATYGRRFASPRAGTS